MFTFIFSLPLISPCWLLAFLIFSRQRRYEIVMFFSQRNSIPFFLITRSKSFCLSLFLFLHVSANIKTNVEKDTTFFSKSLGGNTISCQKHPELSVVSYLLTELFYIGMPVVWTNGRTYGHVITKISQMGGLPNFLTHGAPLRIKKWTYRVVVIWSCFVFCCLSLQIWWIWKIKESHIRGKFKYS